MMLQHLRSLTCSLVSLLTPNSKSSQAAHTSSSLCLLAWLLLLIPSGAAWSQTATPSATFLSFNAASIGVSAGSAQSLTASFAVSGYTGSFTPTALLHYGHDYTLGAVSCTPSGASETCTVSVKFQPTLPGARKDAIFLMNGTTRLATVLLNGVGQGPFALLQPGVFSTSVPNSVDYIYQSVTDENGTVYLLPSGNRNYITSVTKAGVVSQLSLTSVPYFWTIGIDGAGVLYLFGESKTVTTYDTVQGIQGTYAIPYTGSDTDWYPGTIDGQGNFYILDTNNSEFYEFNADRTSNYQEVLNPGINQAFTATVDSQGSAFIGGYTINKITSSGVQSQVNTVGASDGLAIDAADTLYATRYSPTGGVAMLPASDYTTALTALDKGASPLGVSVGSDGTVFVSNYNNLDVIDRQVSQTSSSIDFGQVYIGQTGTSTLGQIYNGGNQPLTISAVSLAGPAFTVSTSGPDGSCIGAQIAPGALCQLTIAFAPTHPGLYIGTITISTNSLNNSNAIQTLQVQGENYGAYVTVSPATLAFGSQQSGATSGTMTETVTNAGYGEAVSFFTPVSTDPAFSVSPGSCSGALAVGSTCQLNLTFSPTAVQSYTSTIKVPYIGNTSSDQATATFTATGTGTGSPVLTLSVNQLTFGNQNVNTTSAPQTITLTSTGTAAVNISSISLTGTNPGDFAETNNCPSSLAPNATCTVQVTFTPLSVAIFSANVTIASNNAGGSPQIVSVDGDGIGVPAATLTPSSAVSFGSQTVNTTSAAQSFTLSSTGSAPLTVSSIFFNGSNPTDFAQTNNCTSTLASGSSCTIQVTFTPLTTGSLSANFVVTDSSATSPHSVPVSGTGTATAAPIASVSPSSVSFGSVTVNSSATAATVTLSNTGNATLTLSGITISGSGAAVFTVSDNCDGSVAAGASCTLTLGFKPTAAQGYSATVNIADNASGSPQLVSLSGNGASAATFSLASGTTQATVTPTTPAQYALSIASVNGSFNSPVQLSVTGLPAGYTASFNPQTVTPGDGTASSTMTVQLATLSKSNPAWFKFTPVLSLAVLLLVPYRRRKAFFTWLLLVVGLLGTVAISGCGAGWSLPTSTSTLTVSATSGNTTQTTTVQLTVQQ